MNYTVALIASHRKVQTQFLEVCIVMTTTFLPNILKENFNVAEKVHKICLKNMFEYFPANQGNNKPSAVVEICVKRKNFLIEICLEMITLKKH